ncbi:D-arabinono-1,4-lactone oxidase-domain-containing protein [Mycena epipterygia]|nr:D-arabinono-1,4-lactone oxidase-domain-containing protein [Mycena epipterygia]
MQHPHHLSRAQLVRALDPIAVTRPSWENWGRTFHCVPRALFRPTTPTQCRQVLELAKRDNRKLRAVGIGHSPSDIACTRDYMLDMTGMNRVLEINTSSQYVVAEAGITLTDLHAALAPHGLAMRNLGSISDQTLAGIVATATHGSGVAFGVLSTHVRALTLLRPDNTLVSCSPTENRDLFIATVCGLGATGLIMTITLELTSAFRLKDRHTVRPFSEVLRDLDHLKVSGEHVRLWWFPAVGLVRCSVADRTEEPARPAASWFWNSLIGFHAVQLLLLLTRFSRCALPVPRALARLLPVASVSCSSSPPAPIPSPETQNAIIQNSSPSSPSQKTPENASSYTYRPLHRANTWAARLACWLAGPGGDAVDESWKVFNIECRYPQHTTEWALPSANAGACLAALGRWLEEEGKRGEGERPHFPIEVRWSAGDDLWLSPSGGGETCWIGIVQYKPYNLPTRYRALFAEFEAILAAHGGRPHWAKAHHLDARATRALYPQFGKFLKVVEEVDPTGVFRNEYIERHLMGGAGDGREYKRRQLPVEGASSHSAETTSSTTTTTTTGIKRRDARGSWWTWPWTWWRSAEKAAEPEWERDWHVLPPGAEESGDSGDSAESDTDSDATLADANPTKPDAAKTHPQPPKHPLPTRTLDDKITLSPPPPPPLPLPLPLPQ